MKKVISVLLVCVLLIGTVCALASCGGKTLSGTYKRDGLFVDTTYTFTKNEVTIKNSVGGAVSFESKATYVIEEKEDGSFTITFTYAEGETPDDDLKGTQSFTEGKEGDVQYIKIGGVQYNKQ